MQVQVKPKNFLNLQLFGTEEHFYPVDWIPDHFFQTYTDFKISFLIAVLEMTI